MQIKIAADIIEKNKQIICAGAGAKLSPQMSRANQDKLLQGNILIGIFHCEIKHLSDIVLKRGHCI